MRNFCSPVVCGLLFFSTAFCAAGDPLEVGQRIEASLQKKMTTAKVTAAGKAGDAEFLRRAYLDITGRTPTYDQAVAFLEDTRNDKRAKLIDELLGRPEFGVYFATLWRDLMVDRSSDQQQNRNIFSWEFIPWMGSRLNEDRGWNEIVTELLVAEGEAKSNPATLLILAARMNGIPRAESTVGLAGKLFLGVQIACAQCHDHPYVEEWKQDDFWALAAFFNQLRDHGMDGNGGSQNPHITELPITDVDKNKRYLGNLKRQAFLPPEPGAKIAVADPTKPGQTLRVVAAKLLGTDTPPLADEGPYRQHFATWMTSAENPFFARAAANRMWAHFLGSGLVNPLDDLSPISTPSHPDVLDLLAKEFTDTKFSVKHLVRCVCNSPAYQRSSRPPTKEVADPALFSHQVLKLMTPDQMLDAVSIALGRTPPVGKNREQSTAPFVTKEADAPVTEFSHGVPQFLYQMNGYTASSAPNYLGRVTANKNVDEALATLYLSILARRPNGAELEKAKAFLVQSANSGAAYRDLAWVLMNSAEFMFVR